MWDDIQVGDTVVVEMGRGRGSWASARVVRRLKASFEVQTTNGRHLRFTYDGQLRPRPDTWAPGAWVYRLDDEHARERLEASIQQRVIGTLRSAIEFAIRQCNDPARLRAALNELKDYEGRPVDGGESVFLDAEFDLTCKCGPDHDDCAIDCQCACHDEDES